MKSILLSLTFLSFVVCCTAQTEISLEQKRFSKNWFNNLDKALANPDSVFFLDLSLQKLKTFPKEIFKFKNVRELYLSYNYWDNIPEGLGELKQVTILDLSGNYFLHLLPFDLWKMKNLKELDIKDNLLNAGEDDKAKKHLPNTKVQASVHKEK